MKGTSKFLWFIVLFFVLLSDSFAIDAPMNFKVDDTSNVNSVVWDNVEWALWYFVYYSTESGIEKWYENQSGLIEENKFEWVDLIEWTTYYLTVVSIDENWEESIYSDEIIIAESNTDSEVTNNEIIENNEIMNNEVIDTTFALESINNLSLDILEVWFTVWLEDSEDAVREFKITNKNDSLDTFNTEFSYVDELDNTKVILTLDRELELGNEYEVVVIAINDINGNNIEAWIDSFEIFTVKEITEEENIEINSWVDNTDKEVFINEEENIELNSWVDEEQTLEEVAASTTKLADTGPEHILLLIVSIIFWAFIFKFKYKKAIK